MPKKPGYVPSAGGQTISTNRLERIFVANNRFDLRGRPLVQPEVFGIISIMCDLDDSPPLTKLLEHFDNPKDPLTIKIRALVEQDDQHQQDLKDEVGNLLETWRAKDEAKGGNATDRMEILEGLLKRLPMRFFVMPEWNQKRIRFEQLCILYPLYHFCRDDKDNHISEFVAIQVARIYVFKVEAGSIRVFELLATPEKDITKAVAEVMMDRAILLHFANMAHGMHVRYTQDKGFPLPKLSLPPDPIAAVTETMRSSTLTATASASGQPTRGGPHRSNIKDLLSGPSTEEQGREEEKGSSEEEEESSEEEEEQEGRREKAKQPFYPHNVLSSPSPSGSKEPDSTIQGKGKARAYESSSESPGDTSGKGKGKAPKKPRRSGK